MKVDMNVVYVNVFIVCGSVHGGVAIFASVHG